MAQRDTLTDVEAIAAVPPPIPLDSRAAVPDGIDDAIRAGAARAGLAGASSVLADLAGGIGAADDGRAVDGWRPGGPPDPSENPDGDRAAGRLDHVRNDLLSD